MRLIKVFLIFILFAGAVQTAFSFNVDGSFTTSYETEKDKGEGHVGTWENTLIIDNLKLLNPYLGFNFHGSYSDENGKSYEDIYSAYLDFKTFEDAVAVKLGRFSFLGNKFVTLDGAEVTVRTPHYFGVTAYAGRPEFYNYDDRHINETFRDQGNRLYGGKVFLNGVKYYNAYLSYSKEEKNSTTIQELVGLGLGRTFVGSDGKESFLSVEGRLDYDTDEKDLYRGTGRIYARYKKLAVITEASRIRIEDGSEKLHELVITNFSSGKEDRYAYTIEYGLNDNYAVYQSTVHTNILNKYGKWVTGDIYKLGLNVDHYKTHGLTSGMELYLYDGSDANANGARFNIDWSITRELKTRFSAEYVGRSEIKNAAVGMDKEKDIYSLYAEISYAIIKSLTISLYGENNKETRYLPDNKYGIKAQYIF